MHSEKVFRANRTEKVGAFTANKTQKGGLYRGTYPYCFNIRVPPRGLHDDLDRLSVLEDQWDMEFNPHKSQVVRVITSKKIVFFDSVYTLHGQILELVTSARYLGVDISSGLSWNSHIDCITGNASRAH